MFQFTTSSNLHIITSSHQQIITSSIYHIITFSLILNPEYLYSLLERHIHQIFNKFILKRFNLLIVKPDSLTNYLYSYCLPCLLSRFLVLGSCLLALASCLLPLTSYFIKIPTSPPAPSPNPDSYRERGKAIDHQFLYFIFMSVLKVLTPYYNL